MMIRTVQTGSNTFVAGEWIENSPYHDWPLCNTHPGYSEVELNGRVYSGVLVEPLQDRSADAAPFE